MLLTHSQASFNTASKMILGLWSVFGMVSSAPDPLLSSIPVTCSTGAP